MSYDGLFTLDSAEFANASRFSTYAAQRTWWKGFEGDGDLAYGQVAGLSYSDPATDRAPWYDLDEPASTGFYGFYPLTVTGLEDSSRQGDVVESTLDGGIPGRIRHATKEVVFSGVIAGNGEEAVEYGMRWLRRTLLGAACSPLDARKQALGAELRYLAATPDVSDVAVYEPLLLEDFLDEGTYLPEADPLHSLLEDPDDEGTYLIGSPLITEDPDDEGTYLVGSFWGVAEGTGFQILDRLTRVRRKAAVTRGPQVNATKRLTCGDVLWAVSFTMTIGDPMLYGSTKRVFSDLFTPEFAWSDLAVGTFTDFADYDEVLCGDPVYMPLFDPACSNFVNPPTVPNVPLGCWVPPTTGETWKRASITIPANNFTVWGEKLPIITLRNDTGTDIRDLRLRFFRDPTGDLDPMTEQLCSFVSDIVVSYLPQGTMVIDGVNQDVHHTTAGGATRRADSLLFSSKMRPIDWPVLTCGDQYVMTVDWRMPLPLAPNPPGISLDLVPRAV